MRDIIIKNIYQHLISLGYSEQNSISSVYQGWNHFERAICNSKDAFKDACDHAGEKAKTREPKVKYKSPASKRAKR